jgi:uncharacterized circularly permuted ATP-grasp superfamily protein/uncharacterized alpha-E superfamily protein
MASPRSRGADPLARRLADYRPEPGIPDELLGPDGRPRPVWQPLLRQLAQWSEGEFAAARSRADQYLHDAGVFYRHLDAGGSSERPWPLSHVPVLIDGAEWKRISAGLIQRAELLEAIVADLYGANRLVAEGHLPAGLIAASPEWLRPLVGVTPASGQYLSFLAFEIGRGPDGNWWVLGDRTQAPSGAGFALENRLAVTRAFPEVFAKARVLRLARFFRQFKEALLAGRSEAEGLVGILTPGPLSATYFEHAYLARYLGIALLEGDDLTVTRRARTMVRTVEGLQPVSVLWRRLDANWVDPLELLEGSQLGTPGLVNAVRNGSLSCVNALGAGVLETRALLAFLPRLCEHLRGEPLLLPNIATWWCGQPAERDYVLTNAARMWLDDAHSTRQAFDVEGGLLTGMDRADLAALLEREGASRVAQEAVTLSTTPAFVDGRLVPRPMSLRVFLAWTAEGWRVMPGGFARVGVSQEAAAISLQAGAAVADVWIVPESDSEALATAGEARARTVRAPIGALPARAADNLYWLGRYVERAESLMRLTRAFHVRAGELTGVPSALLEAVRAHGVTLGVDLDLPAARLLNPVVAAAVTAAGRVRDRFSPDGWLLLADIRHTVEALGEVAPGFDTAAAMGGLLRQMAGFSGLVQENMLRSIGWRFMSIGRSLERAQWTAAGLARLTEESAPEGALELAIELGDSAMAYRGAFTQIATRASVLELLAFESRNPRSLLHLLEDIRAQVEALPQPAGVGGLTPIARAALRLYADLAVHTPARLEPEVLLSLRSELAAFSDLLTQTWLR